eukprot:366304-Chlamydomonas_euryale.AAC.7
MACYSTGWYSSFWTERSLGADSHGDEHLHAVERLPKTFWNTPCAKWVGACAGAGQRPHLA